MGRQFGKRLAMEEASDIDMFQSYLCALSEGTDRLTIGILMFVLTVEELNGKATLVFLRVVAGDGGVLQLRLTYF